MADTRAQVVTRFAPSPTGELHIGGARTALYSWAYARRHRGRYLLRFEDTDQKRSSKQAEDNIRRDLEWLGLTSHNWDDIPRQSDRQAAGVYDAAVDKLTAAGLTYEDDGAVRLKMDQDISFRDEVYGDITVKADELEDFVIRKADGFPTFHLAVVVDDAEMGITHVIRGQEHLSNTPKHARLYDALGHARPVWAHTPSIMNPDGSKMSKRDKAKAAQSEAETWMKQPECTPNLLTERVARHILHTSFPELDAPSINRFLHKVPTGCSLADGGRKIRWSHPENYDKEQQEGLIRAITGPMFAFLGKENANGAFARDIAHVLGKSLPEIDVVDFRKAGYLPNVLLNYVALLGWNPGDDIERFDLDFLAQHFSFERINKKNAKFDREKLAAFSQETLAALPSEDFAAKLRGHFSQFHKTVLDKLGDGFGTFAAMYQERSKTLEDPATLGAFFIAAPSEYVPKAVKKNLTKNDGEGLATLAAFRDVAAAIDPWDAPTIQAALEAFTAEKQLKNMGGIAQPLRVAMTGNAVSPPIDATLALLGKDEVLQRIDACISAIGTEATS